jgi:hypothetical protein
MKINKNNKKTKTRENKSRNNNPRMNSLKLLD